MNKGADAQNVPIAEAVLYDFELQAQLLCDGKWVDATVLRVIAHAEQAFDMPRLTHAARTYRLQNLQILLRAVLHNTMSDSKLASTIIRQSTVLGFTTELLTVLLANVESRAAFIEAYPAAVLMLVEQSLSTDDLECEFSMLVTGCGYKPTLPMTLNFFAAH